MQNKVELCGVNTAKLKVLKNEETQALLRRAKAGDRQAREELIRRAHDHRRDPAVSPGQQHYAGIPRHAGHRL